MAAKKIKKSAISDIDNMANKSSDGGQNRPMLFERTFDLIIRFQKYAWEIAGVVLSVIAGVTLLALIGITSGEWVTGWAEQLQLWFGLGKFLIPITLGIGAAWILVIRRIEGSDPAWGKVVAIELAFFAFLALLSIMGDVIDPDMSALDRSEQGMDGGLLGWGIAEFVRILLRSIFPENWIGARASIILMLIVIAGALAASGQVSRLILLGKENMLRYGSKTSQPGGKILSKTVSVTKKNSGKQKRKIKGGKKKTAYIPAEHRKQFKFNGSPEENIDIPARDQKLPPLELLLEEKSMKPNERHINQNAGLIEKTLAEFGVPAKVVGFQVGPTITQFAVEPGYINKQGADETKQRTKVRVSKISALQRDLALALSAQRLRIQAPVPGRSFVGIEVPNLKSDLVRLRPILQSDVFYRAKSSLALALGRDVSGQIVVADLAKMPHLLIAGTTGSGKSVCISAITICLAMNNSPDDLKMVMIDPKMVELVPFNGLPHLLGKVETDLERIAAVLRWVVLEMDKRYKLFEELSARDLAGYNRKAGRRKEFKALPRIVVLIDELADLMMTSAEQTEATLIRLAQMGRATGIHLVVATQRPSSDVVTGLIKANFPARLSFAVASSIDSRVILDESGAETLLGRGDMLYLAPESGTTIRSQGVMVSDQEIENVITFWQKNWNTLERETSPWDVLVTETQSSEYQDDMVQQAIAEVTSSGRASASHLQRKLHIGYPRAARLMDELEDLGIVGPTRAGGREREVLITLE